MIYFPPFQEINLERNFSVAEDFFKFTDLTNGKCILCRCCRTRCRSCRGILITALRCITALLLIASVLLLITASQISTVKNRSLTITADGKKYTIRELDNADDFAQAVRERIRGMMQERAAALQMQTAHMQNPEDQFHAAEHLLQQGKITPEQFNSMQQMQ